MKNDGGNRIAVMWPFNYADFRDDFDLAVGTLLGSGASNVDIHIIVPTISPSVASYMNGSMRHDQVFVHIVTADDWKKRVETHTGITVPYEMDQKTMGRKTADFKPMLGHIFQDFIPRRIYSYWVYGDCDGLFGSYDNILDYNVVQHYDVIAGSSISTNQSQTKLLMQVQSCTGTIEY